MIFLVQTNEANWPNNDHSAEKWFVAAKTEKAAKGRVVDLLGLETSDVYLLKAASLTYAEIEKHISERRGKVAWICAAGL